MKFVTKTNRDCKATSRVLLSKSDEPISTRGSILVCITFPSFLASPVCKGISRVVLSKF